MRLATLVVVCGLTAEARIAEAEGVTVIAGGGDGRALLARLDAMRPQPDALLSFGIAGGLAPNLAPGDVRAAQAIVVPDGSRIETDCAWTERLAAAVDAPVVAFAGVDAPLARANEKAALHRSTGAELVDMESHLAAGWAAAHGARFAALRVVTDAATTSLPHAAAVGMRADGKVDLKAILASLARQPAQLPALIRTGLDARRAFAALLRCRQRLGPGFALLDL